MSETWSGYASLSETLAAGLNGSSYRAVAILYFSTMFASAPFISIAFLFLSEAQAVTLSALVGAVAAFLAYALSSLRNSLELAIGANGSSLDQLAASQKTLRVLLSELPKRTNEAILQNRRTELMGVGRAVVRKLSGSVREERLQKALTELQGTLERLDENGSEECTESMAEFVALVVEAGFAGSGRDRSALTKYDMETWFSGDSRWTVVEDVLDDAIDHLLASDDDEPTKQAVAMLALATRKRAQRSKGQDLASN